MKNLKLDMNEFAKTCLEYDLKTGVLVKVGEDSIAFAHDIEDNDYDRVKTIEWQLEWYKEDATILVDCETEEDKLSYFDKLKQGLTGEIEMANSAYYAYI